jgi:DNA-binding response OmpR family regulator
MSERTLLIVDDDEAIAHLLSVVFRDEGYGVITARHGAEALEQLEHSTPDAILLDLAMPVMDGRTFYRRLREHASDTVRSTPVLIISAVGARRARRELGAEACMEKPVDLEDLVAEVERLVSAKPVPPVITTTTAGVKKPGSVGLTP